MAPTVKDVIEKYREIRDNLDARRTEFKLFEKETKADLDRLEMWLRKQAKAQGVTSFQTPAGTAYQTTKSHVRIGDWDVFSKFIMDNNLLHCMEKRPAKLATLEVMKEMGFGKKQEEGDNEPAFSPESIGITYTEEVEFTVRKPGN